MPTQPEKNPNTEIAEKELEQVSGGCVRPRPANLTNEAAKPTYLDRTPASRRSR